jgi:pimeloyl-ACP methyl ester carboxylesterase
MTCGLRTLVWVSVLTCGCFRAPVPMTQLDYAVNPPAKCLVVLMPGAGSNAGDFEKEGFVKKLLESGLSLDVIAANATLGYYFKATMVPRLHEDVVGPALQKPYEKKWIMGMSMGGFGSLFYAAHYPHEFDGVFALAPWLGDEKLSREIEGAGGLKKWQAPPTEEFTEANYQRQLWRWLQQVAEDPSKGPELWVGWGRDDSLALSDKLLGDALPEGHAYLTDGAHEWLPWDVLVERFAKEGPLATACRR